MVLNRESMVIDILQLNVHVNVVKIAVQWYKCLVCLE